MNQEKIGRFIAEKRKAKKLTQMQLAEKLNITDRAVSKWETGKSMPDTLIMLDLCNILDITVNELLSGEEIVMEDYEKNAEKNLLELQKQKEDNDKKLLIAETFIGVFSCIVLFSFVIAAALIDLPAWARTIIVGAGMILGIIGFTFALKIEQVAGYYECAKCHHKYIPTFKDMYISMHFGRTRYMKCPKCGKWSWQKKQLHK